MAAATLVEAVIRKMADKRFEPADREIGVPGKFAPPMRAMPAASPHWPMTIKITAISFSLGLIRNAIPRRPGPSSVPSRMMRSGLPHRVSLRVD